MIQCGANLMLYLLFIPWVILQSGGQVNVYVQKLKARQPHWYRTKTRRASVLGENTFFIVCVAPNPGRSPLAAPSNVLLPSNPNNVRLSSAHNCPSDMRTGFVLDWKIWMGCLQSSVILHKQKQIKSQRGRTEHACWFDFFHVFGCIKLQKVPQLSWVSRSDGCRLFESTIWTSSAVIFKSTVVNDDKDESLVDSRGARPSPGTDECPGGYHSDSDHLIPRHAPAMPACLTGHAPLLLQPWGGGRWVMVTQITPHHTAYLHLTPNSTKSRVSHRSDTNCAHWGCQALSFRRVFYRTVTCSSGRSCDPVVQTNRVAQFVLGRAKGRGEKKNIFPLRFLIFQRRKWSSSAVSCAA